MENNRLQETANLFKRNYTEDFIDGIIKKAGEAFKAWYFESMPFAPYDETPFDERFNKWYNAKREALCTTKKTLETTSEELEEIARTFYNADRCEELTDEEVDNYIDLGNEANKLLERVNYALDDLEEAQKAYERLEEALDNMGVGL